MSAGLASGQSAEWPTITGLSRIPETLAFKRGYVHLGGKEILELCAATLAD